MLTVIFGHIISSSTIRDHLKLTDFGSAAKYGSHLEVGTPLYARWHSVEIGDEDNSLGDHGSNV